MADRRTKVNRDDVKIAGVPNPAAAIAAISAFIARSGVTKAIAKYGEKAVMAIGKNRNKVTKREKNAGPSGSVPTKTPNVQGSKMSGGTRMPPNKLDVKAAQAARRKANEEAQMGRGKSRIKKGAGTVGAAGAAYGVGETVRIGAEGAAPAVKAVAAGERGRKNKAEVERLRRVGQRNAFRQAGEREAKKTTTPTSANDVFTKAITTRKKGDTTKTLTSNKRTKTPPPAKTNLTGAKNISASRRAGGSTFTGKDGEQKANVTAEELKASGMSLRDYLNKKQGKTRRPEMKKGGPVNKTTKVKKTNKVRGSGIAIRGVRPAKMR